MYLPREIYIGALRMRSLPSREISSPSTKNKQIKTEFSVCECGMDASLSLAIRKKERKNRITVSAFTAHAEEVRE